MGCDEHRMTTVVQFEFALGRTRATVASEVGFSNIVGRKDEYGIS